MRLKAILLAATMATVAFAADVTGKWVAQVAGRDGQTHEVTYNLKVDGTTLTGSIAGGMGPNEQQISDGKVDGDNISFKVKAEYNGNSMVVNYKGTVSGDEIKLTSQREGSDRPPREITAKRAK